MGVDSSNNLHAQKGHALQIMHVPTGKIVEFKAFLTDFDDKYTSNWAEDAVYGRMDPIATFQGTTRAITIAWEVPAFSNDEARLNLQKASLLFQMLYPVYEKSETGLSGAGQINAAPLLKIKFANLICSMTNGSQHGGVATSGLLGYVDGFSLKPNFENQFYDPEFGEIYPMSFALSCTFKVLHTHKLGWTAEGGGKSMPRHPPANDINSPQFPYGSPFPDAANNYINQLGENDTQNEADPNSVAAVANPDEEGSMANAGDDPSGFFDENGQPIPNSHATPDQSTGPGAVQAAEAQRVLESQQS